MKLITLTITTFLALLTPTALAWDESISEREDPYTRLLLKNNLTEEVLGELWLKEAWENKHCIDIAPFQATWITVDRWNCGTQQCTAFESTDCTGEGYAFFSRGLDKRVGQWLSVPWGSVKCGWEDRSSCSETAPITSAPGHTPKR
ncbi:uncharacterized protein N7458_007633 [Penicillium daleae]|uniref:Uncharacterized protein n=1 Tax=Penicillium daleae TaxID=63821 RepID=A0AAD6C1F3_9EURO|nr:uncharacterized protein N7458_007633 [Penicillium daleae]KAJ5443761.1 hypothetical protein N7458_007633 [Penicillium daleae]